MFKKILDTATFKQSSITFGGTFINGLLGAIFYILVARNLGPDEFGVLVISITTLTLIADISELGIGTGLVRFVGGYLNKQKEKALKFLKLGLKIKISLAVVISIVGWLSAGMISEIVFKKVELTTSLKLSFLGVAGTLLFTFSVQTFQAFQMFWHWSSIQIGTNALRLIVIVFLLGNGNLNLATTLITYIAAPMIGFAASFIFLPKQFLKARDEFSIRGEFFHYSKWVALFALLAAISARLDTFLSARLLSTAAVGFYGAATQLVSVIPQIVVSLHTVVSPKMASMGTRTDLIKYMKKVQLLTLALSALILFFSPLVIFLIPILYGSAYAASVPLLFMILLFAMLIFLISVPVHMAVFYYFSYPQLFVLIALGHLAIIGVVGYLMISSYGTVGAAITVLIGTLFNFIVPLVWVLKKLNNEK